MTRYDNPKRTGADRARDCLTFCATARIEAVRAITDADLAARYGVSLKVAGYHRLMRLNRDDRA
jgi:hypothetical protein